MTPQEIADHKTKWMQQRHVAVSFHSDKQYAVKLWLTENVEQHRRKLVLWTDVYEHTVHFERPNDAYHFQTFLKK